MRSYKFLFLCLIIATSCKKEKYCGDLLPAIERTNAIAIENFKVIEVRADDGLVDIELTFPYSYTACAYEEIGLFANIFGEFESAILVMQSNGEKFTFESVYEGPYKRLFTFDSKIKFEENNNPRNFSFKVLASIPFREQYSDKNIYFMFISQNTLAYTYIQPLGRINN